MRSQRHLFRCEGFVVEGSRPRGGSDGVRPGSGAWLCARRMRPTHRQGPPAAKVVGDQSDKVHQSPDRSAPRGGLIVNRIVRVEALQRMLYVYGGQEFPGLFKPRVQHGKRLGSGQSFRWYQGLTQEQVEERSGFSQQYLSGLERGRRNPTIITLYELARALGVSHVELVRPDTDA
eukprot:gene16745-16925_t